MAKKITKKEKVKKLKQKIKKFWTITLKYHDKLEKIDSSEAEQVSEWWRD